MIQVLCALILGMISVTPAPAAEYNRTFKVFITKSKRAGKFSPLPDEVRARSVSNALSLLTREFNEKGDGSCGSSVSAELNVRDAGTLTALNDEGETVTLDVIGSIEFYYGGVCRGQFGTFAAWIKRTEASQDTYICETAESKSWFKTQPLFPRVCAYRIEK